MAVDRIDAQVSFVGELLYTSLTVDVIPKNVSSSIFEVSARARAQRLTAFDAMGFTTKAPLLRSLYLHSAVASATAVTCAAAACPMLLQLIRVV